MNPYKQMERMKSLSLYNDMKPILIKDKEPYIYDNFMNNIEKYDKHEQRMNQYSNEISNKQRDILDMQETLNRMNQLNTLAVLLFFLFLNDIICFL